MSKDYSSEHLRAELKSLADTLEDVLHNSADKSKTEIDNIRSKAEKALKDSSERLAYAGEAISHQTREVASKADDYVHENPWTGVGIGAAVGVVLGILLARR